MYAFESHIRGLWTLVSLFFFFQWQSVDPFLQNTHPGAMDTCKSIFFQWQSVDSFLQNTRRFAVSKILSWQTQIKPLGCSQENFDFVSFVCQNYFQNRSSAASVQMWHKYTRRRIPGRRRLINTSLSQALFPILLLTGALA